MSRALVLRGINNNKCNRDRSAFRFMTPRRILAFLVISGATYTLPAAAQTTVIHSFAGPPSDGQIPLGGLLQDSLGNLYGTTVLGGADNFGALYEISTTGSEKLTYSFTGQADGAYPAGVLVSDRAGNLYGTSSGLPPNNAGTVFEVTPAGIEKTLHTFTAAPDALMPQNGLIWKNGVLLGTSQSGGTDSLGTVFAVTKMGDEKIIHNFSGYPSDGVFPLVPLALDSKGNLFGTAFEGGIYYAGQGAVFEITADGAERLLHSFAGGTDGFWPQSPVILDAEGNLYSTTGGGGPNGGGTVFEMHPAGAKKIVYSFTGGADGGTPSGAIVRDEKGNIYGTTFYGGDSTCQCGVVYEIDAHGKQRVLHAFTSNPDGAYPSEGLVLGPTHILYGTTRYGGTYGFGTVFQVIP